MDKGLGIGDIAVLLTVAGTATYVMGVVAIAWPIYRWITHDAVVTWHVVALIPKTVVVGLGVRILFSFPLIITSVTMLWLILVLFMLSLVIELFDSLAIQAVFLAVLTFIGTKLSGWVFRRPSISWLMNPGRVHPVSEALKRVCNVVGYPVAWSAGFFFAIFGFNLEWPGFIPQISINGAWIVASVAIAFLGSFILGLQYAASIDPPLPKVEIVSSEGDVVVTGRLVGHANGFWHFFTPTNIFVSIPDDQVTSITTMGTDQVWIS